MKNSVSGWRIAAIACLGITCFYIGWADWIDVKPELGRAELQHAIRDTIRVAIQVLVQWVIPIFCVGIIGKLYLRQ